MNKYSKIYTLRVLAENYEDAQNIFEDFEEGTEVGIVDEMMQIMSDNEYDGHLLLDKTSNIIPEGNQNE